MIEITEELVNERLKRYEADYQLSGHNNSNDADTMRMLVRSVLQIEQLQYLFADPLVVQDPSNFKKISDALRDAIANNMLIQRNLGIDRRTRTDSESQSVLSYVESLRKLSTDFLEKRLVKVYCRDCKVMVGRYAPVHSHTSFKVSFQCSQCKKMVTEDRKERDELHDLKGKEWRKKYRADVVQPSVSSLIDEDVTETESSLYKSNQLLSTDFIEITEELSDEIRKLIDSSSNNEGHEVSDATTD